MIKFDLFCLEFFLWEYYASTVRIYYDGAKEFFIVCFYDLNILISYYEIYGILYPWQMCIYVHCFVDLFRKKTTLFTYLYNNGFHPSFKIISVFECSFSSLWSDSTELELDSEAPNKPAFEIVSFNNNDFSSVHL